MRLFHLNVNPAVMRTFQWVPSARLRRHERTNPEALSNMIRHLHASLEDVNGTPPTVPALLVCDRTFTIIDGHHRFEAMKSLGFVDIPAMLLRYDHPDIILRSYSNESVITKSGVVHSGLSGSLMEPKQTSHLVRGNDGRDLYPLSVLSPTCPVMLNSSMKLVAS